MTPAQWIQNVAKLQHEYRRKRHSYPIPVSPENVEKFCKLEEEFLKELRQLTQVYFEENKR